MKIEDYELITEHRKIMQSFADTYFDELSDEVTWEFKGKNVRDGDTPMVCAYTYTYIGGEPADPWESTEWHVDTSNDPDLAAHFRACPQHQAQAGGFLVVSNWRVSRLAASERAHWRVDPLQAIAPTSIMRGRTDILPPPEFCKI